MKFEIRIEHAISEKGFDKAVLLVKEKARELGIDWKAEIDFARGNFTTVNGCVFPIAVDTDFEGALYERALFASMVPVLRDEWKKARRQHEN